MEVSKCANLAYITVVYQGTVRVRVRNERHHVKARGLLQVATISSNLMAFFLLNSTLIYNFSYKKALGKNSKVSPLL